LHAGLHQQLLNVNGLPRALKKTGHHKQHDGALLIEFWHLLSAVCILPLALPLPRSPNMQSKNHIYKRKVQHDLVQI
jgi:hypothetical protein